MGDIKSWTGERLETFVYNENTNEHLHRYALAMDLVAGKRVLDIACGEGYGSDLMAGIAAKVTGVDIDVETILNAQQKYRKLNLDFLAGSISDIPCESNSFDVVISFETIEHHDKHEEMMSEIKRVLAPGGILMISSPDKLNYSDKPKFNNPFHVKELYQDQFEALLSRHFKECAFFGQRSFFGSVIVPFKNVPDNNEALVFKGSYKAIDKNGMESVYIVALASDSPLPSFGTSLLDGAEVLKNQFEEFRLEVTKDAVANITREIRSSWSFRIGYFLLSPVRFFEKIFHA